jgi:uncharacterized membrane protein YhaH (DUF805 family)
MKRKKLDPVHVFLQFLMLSLSLISFILFAYLVDENIWIESLQEKILAISAFFSFCISVISLKIYLKRREKREFLLTAGGFLISALLNSSFLFFNLQNRISFFSYRLGGEYNILILSSKLILAITFFSIWLLGEKNIKGRENRAEELVKRILIVFILMVFFFFILFLSSNALLDRNYFVLILLSIVLMLLLLSFVGQIFLKEWKYRDFSFWIIFSINFLIISEILFFPFLDISEYSLSNLSIIAKLFGQIALLFGLVNKIYGENLNGETSKNKKVSKKI